jgi:hypothetical protein
MAPTTVVALGNMPLQKRPSSRADISIAINKLTLALLVRWLRQCYHVAMQVFPRVLDYCEPQ